jgi:hypothetical protein
MNFARERERHFAAQGRSSGLIVGQELPGRMALGERNLDFFPDGVETIGGDGISHRSERLASRQTGVGW